MALAPPPNRKPHLLRVKRAIVFLVEAEIDKLIKELEPGDKEGQRNLAIWIRQHNVLAKAANMATITLGGSKDGTGQLIYTGKNDA